LDNFNNIKNALEYIDDHLDDAMNFETLAKTFSFFLILFS